MVFGRACILSFSSCRASSATSSTSSNMAMLGVRDEAVAAVVAVVARSRMRCPGVRFAGRIMAGDRQGRPGVCEGQVSAGGRK